MSESDRTHLASELAFLRQRLQQTPPAAALTRRSTESRIRSVESLLAELPVQNHQPATAKLTFRGRPVVGTHGIYAEFALKAVGRFTEAVAMVASSFDGPLAAMGPIPNRDRFQMLITGTALGSFGFELEESGSDQLSFDDESAVANAIGRTQELLAASIGSDEELADAANEIDSRALAKIREFLSVLSAEGATCALEFKGRDFGFRSSVDLQRSIERLGSDNLQEREIELTGSHLTAMPIRRQFEMIVDGGTPIFGRVASGLRELEVVNSNTPKTVRVRLTERRIGTGRPRYVLTGVLEWFEAEQID